MGPFATLAGVRVVAGSVAIPLYGLWAGDVSLSTDQPVPTVADLVLGNLTMRCATYRTASFGGETRCRLVAGVGGWRKRLPSKQYALSGGVRLSMVLGDAAVESGERVNVPQDRSLGTGWVRDEGPASRTLRLLAGDWYVDNVGVTQIAPWPTRRVPTPFTVESQDGGEGRVVIATEDYASWMPNCTFTAPTLAGTFTSGGTLFRFDADGQFRLEVLTSP